MRNAVTALSLSEQEVANLRASVAELKERDGDGDGPATDKERAQLRAAQARLAELSQNFRSLQSEVAKHRYNQDGTQMPVASSFPIRIDPMLSSKVVCIAQLVMLGYSYGNSENAVDAVRVNDTILALEWLESRQVVKITMLGDTEASALRSAFENTSTNIAQMTSVTTATKTSTLYKETNNTTHSTLMKQSSMRQVDNQLQSPEHITTPGAVSDYSHGEKTKRGFDANEMYAARKRAVMMLAMLAVNPPPTLSRDKQEAMAFGALRALANLANKDSAYMVMMLGGVRCATECLKLYPGDPTCAVAAFDIFRGIAVNPSTMSKLKRQQRFKLMPKAVTSAVTTGIAANKTSDEGLSDMDVVGSAAHALWGLATIGGTETQDRIIACGAVDFIKKALSRPKNADPTGSNTQKLIGCLLALATKNPRVQDFLVDNGSRALIRKGLVEHSHVSFKGEFASLRDWTKSEFANPTPLPYGVTVDTSGATVGSVKTTVNQSMVKSASKFSTQNQTTTTTIEEFDEDDRAVVNGTTGQLLSNKPKKRKGFTNEQMYNARKRAVVMMTAVAVNPPGKIIGMTPAQSEDIAHRCLVGLAKLALSDGSSYMVLTNGGPRAAIDCLRIYPSNERVTRAAFRVLRGLLQNPTTMMKFRKQKRFRILPRVVADSIAHFPNSLDVKSEAAHLLWTYSGIGGPDAQEAVLGVDFLNVIKQGLESARVQDKYAGKDNRVRKFVGCTLSLAVKNEQAQNLLVKEGLRSLVRKSLVEFSTISFHGEFAELRDWIRGDRTGARSTGKSSTVREMNVAENQLSKDADETKGYRTHAEAQRLASGIDTPPDYRPGEEVGQKNGGQMNGQVTSQMTSAETTVNKNNTTTTTSRLQTSTVTRTVVETNQEETRQAFAGVERLQKASVEYSKNSKDKNDSNVYTVERALRTLESDTRESHPEACEALAEMFAAQPAVGVEIVMKGGVKSLTSAIVNGSSAFAAGGFALLHMFATAEVTTRRVKADEGITSGVTTAAILGVMRRYMKNQAVQQWGGMVLWALAKDNARCKVATLNARIPGGRGTAAEILTNALRQHSGDGEATAKALCGTIMTFASNSQEWQEALAELGAPQVVMAALETHSTLTFKGEFDTLRSWLRQNN